MFSNTENTLLVHGNQYRAFYDKESLWMIEINFPVESYEEAILQLDWARSSLISLQMHEYDSDQNFTVVGSTVLLKIQF